MIEVRICEFPALNNLWWRCSLSGANGERPARKRLITDVTKSASGIAKTAKGNRSGKKVGPVDSEEIAFGSN